MTQVFFTLSYARRWWDCETLGKPVQSVFKKGIQVREIADNKILHYPENNFLYGGAKYIIKTFCDSGMFEGVDWHRTLEDAENMRIKMIQNRIEEYEIEVEKLRNLL